MTTKELINQYVTAHADNRWMDASELETLLTEFAEKLMANQPKTREALLREYMQATPAERRKFDLSFLDETRKEALAILTDLGYECKLPVEPVSEDLEQEIDRYFNTEGIPVTGGALRDTSRHFAQWQKEQMMKDAIDARVIAIGQNVIIKEENNDELRKYLLSKFQDGDKVKVIIIKE